MPTPNSPPSLGNLLLDALNERDRALIAPHLEPAEYRRGDVLFHARAEVSHVTVLDRGRVDRAACECHASVQRHFREVLGTVYGRDGEMLAVDVTEPKALKSPSPAVTLRETAR